MQELREYARQRAVFAYTHPGTSLEALVDATDAVDAARRQQLLDQANQTDNDIAKRLGTLTSQLKNQQSDLERQEHEQAQISDQLDAKLAALQADQQNVEQAVTDLQARLDAEIQIAALVDAQRKADLEAEKAALQQPQQTISSAGPGQIITPPKAGAFQCPVQGAAYSDDYGGPTGHPGHRHVRPHRHGRGGRDGRNRALRARTRARAATPRTSRPRTATPTTTPTSRSTSARAAPSPRARSSGSPA